MQKKIKKNKVSFGLGCLHFGIKRPLPHRLSFIDYKNELQKTLQKIPSIDQLVIDLYDESTKNYKHELFIDNPYLIELIDGGPVVPKPNFCSISFKIHIPKKLQQKITDRQFSSEDFYVLIDYQHKLPIMIVVTSLFEKDSANAINLVRDFLKNEIEKNDNTYLMVDILGPTPFHADFSLTPSKLKNNTKINVINTKQSGFDNINICYDKNAYKSIDEVQNEVFHKLMEQADVFYYVMQVRANLMNEWRVLEDLINKTLNKKNSFLTCKPFYKINNILILLTEFRKNEIFSKNYLKEDISRTLETNVNIIISDYAQKELKNIHMYPTEDLFKLLSYYFDQKTNIINNLVTLISAIVGVIIGYLISLI